MGQEWQVYLVDDLEPWDMSILSIHGHIAWGEVTSAYCIPAYLILTNIYCMAISIFAKYGQNMSLSYVKYCMHFQTMLKEGIVGCAL